MEPNEIPAALAAAVAEVLETMCFTTVLADSDDAAPPSEDPTPEVGVEVRFEGSPSGGFRVSVPRRVARAVGAGFLGREEAEVSDSQAAEVVCELANMICGSLLSRLENKATFRITHPELVLSGPGAGFGRSATCRRFDLGDGFLTASLELRQAV